MCLILALALTAGLAVFAVLWLVNGGSWVSASFNRHLYSSGGALLSGRVLDRDGDVLSWVENGKRTYYDGATVRKATLHAVGDLQGKIGTSALSSFADQLTGYNPITGAWTSEHGGNDLYLTIDARYNYAAYNALNGRKGAVMVYNYKTGEVLCMVSSPAYDPLDVPDDLETNERYEGVYLNRCLSATYPPGSTFKTVTLAAAIEHIDDLFSRTWTCTGSTQIGEETVTCPYAHGEMDIGEAFTSSCNGVFGQLAVELGEDVLEKYAKKAGLANSYSLNGIPTTASTFDLEGLTDGQLAWAGIGQYHDMVNPCAMMVYMGAIANGGKAAQPKLIAKVERPMALDSGLGWTKYTGRLIDADTAQTLADMMSANVTNGYGAGSFPNMDVCAKSGTAEVAQGEKPHAWFAGFLRNADAPYAFVAVVENGGYGTSTAGSVAAAVLDVMVNGY